MAEIQRITADKITEVIADTGFNYSLILKDYYVTLILYLLRDVKNIYFKGGTALHKIFLNYARLSEDIDLTVTRDVKEIKRKIEMLLKESGLFTEVTEDKRVDRFTRIIAHYKGFRGEINTVFVDLNQKAKLVLRPERHTLTHFYEENIPKFSFNTLARKEIFAEKVRAAIQRNKPRDHFDLYRIIMKRLPLDLKLAEQKCKEEGCEFNIIRMFNKAKKLKKKWDEDMGPLIAEEITFEKVMKTLARHFKLKEEKEKTKKQKGGETKWLRNT